MRTGRPRLDDRNLAIAVHYFLERQLRGSSEAGALYVVARAWGVSESVVRLCRCKPRVENRNNSRMRGSEALAFLDAATKKYDDGFALLYEIERMALDRSIGKTTGAKRELIPGWRRIRRRAAQQ